MHWFYGSVARTARPSRCQNSLSRRSPRKGSDASIPVSFITVGLLTELGWGVDATRLHTLWDPLWDPLGGTHIGSVAVYVVVCISGACPRIETKIAQGGLALQQECCTVSHAIRAPAYRSTVHKSRSPGRLMLRWTICHIFTAFSPDDHYSRKSVEQLKNAKVAFFYIRGYMSGNNIAVLITLKRWKLIICW